MQQVAIVALLSFVLGAHAQWDTSVCSPVPVGNPTSGPPLPTIPDRFETHLETNHVLEKRTFIQTDYYDGPGNRGVFRIAEPNGVELNTIFNYNTGQIIFYTPYQNGYACTVDDAATSPYKFIFPYKDVNGTKMIQSGANVLHFDNKETPMKWIGKDTIRGIPVNHWQTCMYRQSTYSTSVTDYYFSESFYTALRTTSHWFHTNTTKWSSPGTTNTSIPILAVSKGKASPPGKPSVDFDRRINFIHFLPNAMRPETDFETPPGTICQGQISTKPIPKVGDHYKFTMEITQPETRLTLYTEEYYDFKAKFVRIDRNPVTLGGHPLNPVTEIHDFNTGVLYTTDKLYGNCSYKPIPKVAEITAEVLADGVNVRIRDPMEFLQLDKFPYTYTGTRTIRGVTCDVWITQRNDWPANSNLNITSTWEWYFSTSDWVTATGTVFEQGEPMMLELTAPALGIHFIYNIINFNEQEPNLLSTYDISQCYTYLNRRHFQFALPGNFKGIVDVNKDLFRYFVLLSITKVSHVSLLRVSNIQVDFDDQDILVTFTLLDKAPIDGDVQMVVQEVPLDTASKLITDTINAGTFTVTMFVDTNQDPVTLIAKPYSVKEVIREVVSTTTTGYSVASLSILAVCTLLAGGGTGSVAAFFFFK